MMLDINCVVASSQICDSFRGTHNISGLRVFTFYLLTNFNTVSVKIQLIIKAIFMILIFITSLYL
jgi:hypothetical protein